MKRRRPPDANASCLGCGKWLTISKRRKTCPHCKSDLLYRLDTWQAKLIGQLWRGLFGRPPKP